MPHCGVEKRDDHAAVDHALDVLVRLGHGQLAPHHAALDLGLAKAERLDESSMARSGHRPRASPAGGTSTLPCAGPFSRPHPLLHSTHEYPTPPPSVRVDPPGPLVGPDDARPRIAGL